MTEPTDLDDFEYTFTRRALRQIKAESWDEGHRLTAPHSDACEPTCPNPYRPTPTPTTRRETEPETDQPKEGEST